MATSPPLAAGTLCLYFSFDLSPIADWAALRARDAAAAVALACATTGLLPAERVAARSLTAEGAVDIRAAQALPYDGPTWALGQAVRIEYLWSTSLPQMVVRIATRLAFSDGVTAVRIALHGLEAIEGTPIGAGTAFKTNPPFSFGLTHAGNAARWVVASAVRSLLPTFLLSTPTPADVANPYTLAGMYAYYSAPSPPPASTLMYASAPGAANARAAYKSLLPAIEAIAVRCNKSHFFTLLNFSPRAAPTIVSRASDLDDIVARYAGVIMPVAAPPSGAPWRAMNVLKLDCIFSNNYGRHAHTFSARPTGFLWDWQCMGAHVLGVGCLTLQDTFFLWARGTPAAMEIAAEVLDAPFGAPIATSTQATHFVEADEPTKE